MSETLTFYGDKVTNPEEPIQLLIIGLATDGAKNHIRNEFQTRAESNTNFSHEITSNTKYGSIPVIGNTVLFRNVGISASAGLPSVLSADVTVRFPYNVYWTNRMSIPANWESIIQKRLIRTNHLALNLGYSYRSDYYQYRFQTKQDDDYCLIPIFCNDNRKINLVRSVISHGPRLSFVSRGIYANMHYAPNTDLNRPTLFFTITVSRLFE
jgi:hypothetical protein